MNFRPELIFTIPVSVRAVSPSNLSNNLMSFLISLFFSARYSENFFCSENEASRSSPSLLMEFNLVDSASLSSGALELLESD